jgi:RHS repeat-associated protein
LVSESYDDLGTGTADRRWLHADERGSVIAVSNSAGATIATNAYDEYGIPRSTNTGRFQYTGQTWLPELGMYHYKARIYSPTLGRFLQADPIGYGDGMNMYAYVGGDPVNSSDPSGLCTAHNYTMNVFTARGENLGPDQKYPESWTVMVGCDVPFGGGANPNFGDDGINGGEDGHPTDTETMDAIVVTGQKLRRLGGKRIRYNLKYEQIWVILRDFSVLNIKIKLVGEYDCSDGTSFEKYVPASAIPAGIRAVIHSHQNRRSENPQFAFPGPQDAMNAITRGVPTYGLSSVGAWSVSPGSPVNAVLLEGSWGG